MSQSKKQRKQRLTHDKVKEGSIWHIFTGAGTSWASSADSTLCLWVNWNTHGFITCVFVQMFQDCADALRIPWLQEPGYSNIYSALFHQHSWSEERTTKPVSRILLARKVEWSGANVLMLLLSYLFGWYADFPEKGGISHSLTHKLSHTQTHTHKTTIEFFLKKTIEHQEKKSVQKTKAKRTKT